MTSKAIMSHYYYYYYYWFCRSSQCCCTVVSIVASHQAGCAFESLCQSWLILYWRCGINKKAYFIRRGEENQFFSPCLSLVFPLISLFPLWHLLSALFSLPFLQSVKKILKRLHFPNMLPVRISSLLKLTSAMAALWVLHCVLANSQSRLLVNRFKTLFSCLKYSFFTHC